MVDIEEMMRRAQEASEGASRWLNEPIEKSQKIAEQMQADTEKVEAEKAIWGREEGAGFAGQVVSNQQRQVEILGQMFSPETMAQMADTDALIQKTVAEVTSLDMDGMMGQLFGEDMGVSAAALETLEMEETDGEDKDEPVMEQQVVSLVRRSWGINGRSDVGHHTLSGPGGYTLRYQMYCEAASRRNWWTRRTIKKN